MATVEKLNHNASSQGEAFVVAKIKLLAAQRTLLWAGNLSAATIAAYVFWQGGQSPAAIYWLCAHYLLALFRFWDIRRYRRGFLKTRQQRERWLLQYCIASGLSGCTWGSVGFLYLDFGQPGFAAFVMVTMLGVATAGLPALIAHFPSYVTFATPNILGLSLCLFLQGDEFASSLAALIFLYWCLCMGFGYNMSEATAKSIHTERKMAELYEEVSAAKEEIERISEDKSRFMAAISHDVSQPLYSMMLFMQTLKAKLDTDDQLQLLGRLENSTLSLREMFNSMLEVARMEQGMVDRHDTSFPIARVFDNLESEFQVQAEEKNLKFEVDVDTNTIVHTDSVLLARILRNLISNSIKYTETGFVRVSVEGRSEHVYVRVEDSGYGIPPEEQRNIFREYVQIEVPDRRGAKGLGLGLSVVWRLVKFLALELTLESELGKGSIFTITLPLGKEMPEEYGGKTAFSDTEDLDGLHILILEDNYAVRGGLTALLQSWGCITTDSEFVSELKEKLKKEIRPPDLLISDYRLPGDEDGVTAAHQIRAVTDPLLPVIIVSGDGTRDVLDRVKKCKLTFLPKPVIPTELKTAIAKSV